MIYKIFTIARNTFTETIRRPVYTVIISAALFLFIISPSISMYTMDEDIKLLREIGLSTLFLSGLFIAIFSATAAVTDEIESKTVTTVLSKPIPRFVFIIGKFLGVSAAVFLAHYILSIAHIMVVRHGVLEAAWHTHDWVVITFASVTVAATIILTFFLNYTYDWSFCATGMRTLAVLSTVSLVFLIFISKEWKFNPAENSIEKFDIYASILLLFAVLLLVAAAVMFSTRLNVILTLLCCVGVFLVGLISDYVFGRFADQHLWAKIGKVAFPNLQIFWISDAIYEGSQIPEQYIGISAVYAFLYAAGILMLAGALFQRRQVG